MVQLIVLVAFIIIAAYVNMKEEDLFNRVILCLLIALIAFVLGYCYKYSEIYNEPTAIDVYRGNTRLEVTETIKNSVVISRDTVVVFKTK